METMQVIQESHNTSDVILYMAMELSNKKWKLAFSEGSRERFGLGDKVKIISCYEAGRDGFWIDRLKREYERYKQTNDQIKYLKDLRMDCVKTQEKGHGARALIT